MTGPFLSVVIPVLNEEEIIERSLVSLKRQTYRNFEVVLIDDGCTDNTIDIARNVGVNELSVVKGPGLGLAEALRIGVDASKGEIIVRQDADDFSLPARLERQVHFMQENPECVVVGTWAATFDEKGVRCGITRAPTKDSAIRLRLTLEVGFAHASVAIRRSALLACGNYQGPKESPYPEDFDLWSRLQHQGELANIPEILVGFTSRPDGVTRKNSLTIGEQAGAIAARNLASFLNETEEHDRMRRLLTRYYVPSGRLALRDCLKLWSWLAKARLRAGFWQARSGYRPINYIKPFAWSLNLHQVRRAAASFGSK